MKKDWVIWGGCALLFGAGIVWGQMWPKKDFFAVTDIHDLAEILSSMATVAAAFFALTIWKKQIRAQADHDLARRALVRLERFKNAALTQVIDSQFCSGNSHLQYEDYELIKRVDEGIRSRLTLFDEEASSLQALLSEARAIWGAELERLLEGVREIAAEAYGCNKHFLVFLVESANPHVQDYIEADIHKSSDRLRNLGLRGGPNDIAKAISALTSAADTYLKNKLSL